MKPSEETLETLRGIRTEIGAGMVLLPRSDVERAHNNACDRANAIIGNYADGFGLFQMTATAHPSSKPGIAPNPINQELLTALKECREVLNSCALDVAGTPTEEFFKAKVKHCDIVIAKAEGRNV